MSDPEALPEGESTPAPATTGVPCLFCSGPVPAPTRQNVEKLFCRDRCRAGYRDRAVRQAIAEALAAVDETQGELTRLGARLDGAKAMLERVTPKPRLHTPARNRNEST